MKKIVLFAAIAAAVGFASCTAQAPKANLKNEVDTLSYMMGVNTTQGLSDFLVNRMGVDLKDMDAFLQGFIDASTKTSKKDKAYMAGLQVGQQVSVDWFEGFNQQVFGGDSLQSLNKADFLAGFIAAVKGNAAFTLDSARVYVETQTEVIKAKVLESRYAENKAAGEAFLAENAKKEGVVTTESGLQYKVIKEGKGEVPTATSTVKVNYKGTLIDGTEFDSSYKRNEPTTFRADRVIKGCTEALTMMPVGSKWELYIPQELAYGNQQAGAEIKPFSTLIFEIELLEVVKPKKK
jgi:FKBP-type peptidyl-prolyl cis-trans isomerase FklB